ncbi:MAG TPA: cytochrome c oxidase subunit 4, partial [Acidimicrobiales bacterium]|nr:cytochrome c oxidase subunit 4 [Acidimicrobiales bacterium]
MFTTGSKLYFGIAAAAVVAGVVYWYSTDLEFLGTIVLFSVAVVALFLGGVIIAFRDADVSAPAVEAASAADAEGYGRGPRVSPSVWPIVGAFGVGLVAIGLVYDRRWFVGGILVLVATTIEWAVQAWSDRASDDP